MERWGGEGHVTDVLPGSCISNHLCATCDLGKYSHALAVDATRTYVYVCTQGATCTVCTNCPAGTYHGNRWYIHTCTASFGSTATTCTSRTQSVERVLSLVIDNASMCGAGKALGSGDNVNTCTGTCMYCINCASRPSSTASRTTCVTCALEKSYMYPHLLYVDATQGATSCTCTDCSAGTDC